MDFEAVLHRFFTDYSNIQRIFFLRHPDPIYFYLMLQLVQPQTLGDGGGAADALHYSHVVLQIKGRERMTLEVYPDAIAALPGTFVEEMETFRGHVWDRYEAMAKALQWICHRRLTVSGPLLLSVLIYWTEISPNS
jgi:hypothetical protein